MTSKSSIDNKLLLSSKIIICDIEGTTTSISFVKETLFPYALKNTESFLIQNWDTDCIKNAVTEINKQSTEDLKAEIDGAIKILDDSEKDIQIKSIVESVSWMMKNDRKVAALKNLQGLIWEKGYNDGIIKGHVYEDVSKAFESWVQNGNKIYIYSSGSIQAQKLLFKNTEYGNLLPHILGHFDTSIGLKQEKDSYLKIIEELKTSADEILFLTDVVKEAEAATLAGIKVILLDRPGNAPFTDEDKEKYPIISSFTDLMIESQNPSKRKIDNEEPISVEERPAKLSKIEVPVENCVENQSLDNVKIDEKMEDTLQNGKTAVELNKCEQGIKVTDDEEMRTVTENNVAAEAKNIIKEESETSFEKMEVDEESETKDTNDKKEDSDCKKETETKTETVPEENIKTEIIEQTKIKNHETKEIAEMEKQISQIEQTAEKILEQVPDTLSENVPETLNKFETLENLHGTESLTEGSVKQHECSDNVDLENKNVEAHQNKAKTEVEEAIEKNDNERIKENVVTDEVTESIKITTETIESDKNNENIIQKNEKDIEKMETKTEEIATENAVENKSLDGTDNKTKEEEIKENDSVVEEISKTDKTMDDDKKEIEKPVVSKVEVDANKLETDVIDTVKDEEVKANAQEVKMEIKESEVDTITKTCLDVHESNVQDNISKEIITSKQESTNDSKQPIILKETSDIKSKVDKIELESMEIDNNTPTLVDFEVQTNGQISDENAKSNTTDIVEQTKSSEKVVIEKTDEVNVDNHNKTDIKMDLTKEEISNVDKKEIDINIEANKIDGNEIKNENISSVVEITDNSKLQNNSNKDNKSLNSNEKSEINESKKTSAISETENTSVTTNGKIDEEKQKNGIANEKTQDLKSAENGNQMETTAEKNGVENCQLENTASNENCDKMEIEIEKNGVDSDKENDKSNNATAASNETETADDKESSVDQLKKLKETIASPTQISVADT